MFEHIARSWKRFTASATELDAEELRAEIAEFGADPIEELSSGQLTTLTGILQSLVIKRIEGVQLLEAELFDGTGHVAIRWLGRSQIRGVNPGTQIAVQGRIVRLEGKLVMFNPNYTLLPKAAERE